MLFERVPTLCGSRGDGSFPAWPHWLRVSKGLRHPLRHGPLASRCCRGSPTLYRAIDFATPFATAPWLRAAVVEGAPPFTRPLTLPTPWLRPPDFALLSRERRDGLTGVRTRASASVQASLHPCTCAGIGTSTALQEAQSVSRVRIFSWSCAGIGTSTAALKSTRHRLPCRYIRVPARAYLLGPALFSSLAWRASKLRPKAGLFPLLGEQAS